MKVAHDINVTTTPNNLYFDGDLIPDDDVPEVFASYFDNKIKKIQEEIKIDSEVYHGKSMIESTNKMFMDPCSSRELCRLSNQKI